MVTATFRPQVASVAAARRFVRDTLRDWGVEAIDDATLLTSELVTNAIVHAGTDVEVRCKMDGAEILIEVGDRHQERRVPAPGLQVNGRGLLLPEALATSWGITYGNGGKRVWFTIPAGSAAFPADLPSEPDDAAPEPTTLPRPGAPTLGGLLQQTAEAAQDALNADSVYVLLAEEGAELSLRATAGVPARAMDLEASPVSGTAAGRGVYADLGGSPYNLPYLREAGVRSLVTAPFVVDNRVTGLLIAAAQQPARFNEGDGERLQRIADRAAPSVERARLVQLERTRRGWLSFLAEASDLLAGTLDQKMAMALVAQLVVPRLATWCALFMVHEFGTATPAYVWHADETLVTPLQALLDQLPAVRPVAEPAPWDGHTAAPSDTVSPAAFPLVDSVAHAFPLVARGRRIGMLTIGRPAGTRFPQDILDLAEDLARRAALAIDNGRLYSEQAETSRALQRSLLPPDIPKVPGLDIAVVYEPAGEHSEVGGDFYDVFSAGRDSTGKRRWRFAIGDVCGTGPEAAAVTGLARHTLRILGRENYAIPDVLQHLNRLILDEGPRARFLTLLHGEIVGRDGGGVELTLAAAGHPPPLVLSPDGKTTEVTHPQLILGSFPEATFTAETVHLDPGQLLLAFTDGVTERRSGNRMLGDDRGLEWILSTCTELNAGAVAARILRAVEGFSTEPSHDDLALIVLRVL